MTDNSSQEKSMAELETEARERARSTVATPQPEQNSHIGQPEVTRFRKPSNRRTILVTLLSFAGLIVLALSGDHLFGALKQSDGEAAGTLPNSSTGNLMHERKNLGMDHNPFGLAEPDAVTDNTQIPSPSPPPSTLNKAAALADGLNGASAVPQRNNAQPAHDEQGTEVQASASGDIAQKENDGVAKITSVQRLGLNPDLYLPVDRYIPCSMMQRFVSDVGGRISCLISEDVYSASGNVKLVPQGTIARGIYQTGALQHGRSRMLVLWTELRTPEPDSLQIPLIDTEASGPLGEAGVAGWVDTHFWERFGNALMLSTIQDVAAGVTNSSPGKDRNIDYTENSRAAASEMARTTLENSINIPPTMYLNQGDVIGIMTGSDIDFSSVWQLRLKKRWYER
ncbi:VirB10/TraB/TrbI family type IV secretion system protein [Kosakonia sp. YIM B13611]|uniref:VirB10/TraB/TrbI family type IV secretion system protein n=1 Tax=unclassified Kosakonia TaxID=2632876 RepID=UPI0036AC3346